MGEHGRHIGAIILWTAGLIIVWRQTNAWVAFGIWLIIWAHTLEHNHGI